MTLPRVATAIRVRGGQGTPAQLPAVSPVQGQVRWWRMALTARNSRALPPLLMPIAPVEKLQHVVFEFDAVFDEAASQLDVYREVCEPLANAFVQVRAAVRALEISLSGLSVSRLNATACRRGPAARCLPMVHPPPARRTRWRYTAAAV